MAPPIFTLAIIMLLCYVMYYILLVSLVIGMIGAFIFILLQVIFLVDFAHSWAEAWSVKLQINSYTYSMKLCFSVFFFFFISCRLEKQRETENWCWYIALLIPTIIFYVIAIVGVILMFVFFVEVLYHLLNSI